MIGPYGLRLTVSVVEWGLNYYCATSVEHVKIITQTNCYKYN